MSAQVNQCHRKYRCSEQRPPTLISDRPHWTTALKRLTSPHQWRCCLIPEQPSQADYYEDFFDKGKKTRLNNSSTTCDLSDDDSEASIEFEGLGFDLHGKQRLSQSLSSIRYEPQASSVRRGHVRSKSSANVLNKTKRRSSTSRPKRGNRVRLGSNSSLSLKTTDSPRCRNSASRPRLDSSSSITTVDSLHRRSSANWLPKLDAIWNKPIQSPVQATIAPVPLVKVRPSLYHSRGISIGTQISAITLDDHDDDHDEIAEEEDELCFDLSVSEKEEKDDYSKIQVIETAPSPVSENHPAGKTHNRKMSVCCSPTGADSSPTCVIQQGLEGGTDTDGNMEVIPYVPDIRTSQTQKEEVVEMKKEARRPPPSPNSKRWIRKNSRKPLTPTSPSPEGSPRKLADAGPRHSTAQKAAAACEYLPIHPVPRLAIVSAKAAVLSAGWAAVFWDSPIAKLPTRYSIEVPKVGPEDLYYIQLLTGGMLQLTPLSEAEEKMVLVTPKAVAPHGNKGENWRVPLVSRRAGHCLVMEAAASTIKSQQHKVYILPVNIPTERVTQLSLDSKGDPKGTESEEDILFAPFGVESQPAGADGGEGPQPYAPYHQHDAVMHLRFAMEAALSMDAALRSGRSARR